MWHELREKMLNVLLGTAEGKRPLERTRRRKYNIKTDLPQIRQEGVNWIDLAQGKDNRRVFANTVTTFELHNKRRIR